MVVMLIVTSGACDDDSDKLWLLFLSIAISDCMPVYGHMDQMECKRTTGW